MIEKLLKSYSTQDVFATLFIGVVNFIDIARLHGNAKLKKWHKCVGMSQINNLT